MSIEQALCRIFPLKVNNHISKYFIEDNAKVIVFAGRLDEIVEEGISGLKVPVRTLKGKRQADVKCLAGKMAFLLDNPIYAKELGENGRKRFLEKYNLPLFKEKMMNLYNSV